MHDSSNAVHEGDSSKKGPLLLPKEAFSQAAPEGFPRRPSRAASEGQYPAQATASEGGASPASNSRRVNRVSFSEGPLLRKEARSRSLVTAHQCAEGASPAINSRLDSRVYFSEDGLTTDSPQCYTCGRGCAPGSKFCERCLRRRAESSSSRKEETLKRSRSAPCLDDRAKELIFGPAAALKRRTSENWLHFQQVENRRKSVEHVAVSDLLGYTQLPTYSEDSESDASDEDKPTKSVSSELRAATIVREESEATLQNDLSNNLRSYLQAVIESILFQAVTLSCIVANAAIIGMETDFPEKKCWAPIENGFLMIFTVELVLRIVVQGPKIFFCGDWGKASQDAAVLNPRKTLAAFVSKNEAASTRRKPISGETEVLITLAWNLFDFTIVVMGAANSIVTAFGIAHVGGDVTLFRAIRLLRILRVLRVIRVLRFLKQLYLLAYGFIEGTMAVFWVAVLASCCIYIFSIVLVKSYGHPDTDDPDHAFFITHFGTVPRTMFTLFQILASPSLGEYRDVIFDHPPLVAFLLFFVIFGSFGISGLLTGVITESIIDKNQARIEEQRQERELKRRTLEEQSGLLFDEMAEEVELETEDEGNHVALTSADLISHQENISLLFKAAGVAIPTYDYEQMFRAMDFSDSGNITKAEFVHGILELCEDVRPMSIMELHSQVSKVKIKVGAIQSDVEELRNHVEGPPSSRHKRTASHADDIPPENRRQPSPRRRPPSPRLARQKQDRSVSPAHGSREHARDTETSRQLERHEALLVELKKMVQTLITGAEVQIQSNTPGDSASSNLDLSSSADLHSGLVETTPGDDANHISKDSDGAAAGTPEDSSSDHLAAAVVVTDVSFLPSQQQATGSVFAPGAATTVTPPTAVPTLDLAAASGTRSALAPSPAQAVASSDLTSGARERSSSF